MKRREAGRRPLSLLTPSAFLLVAFATTICTCIRSDQILVPNQPVGNAASYRYVTEDYGTVSTDRDDNQIRYVFDWGDGEFDTTELYNSGRWVYAPHTWLTEGMFKVKTLAINSKGKPSPRWSDELAVTVGPNDRPNPPEAIGGVDGGVVNQYIRFTTKSTDPDGDSMYIMFIYDTTRAGRRGGWLGPVSGDTYVHDSAKYDTPGTYFVVAYAEDMKGAISDPSPVKMLVIAPLGGTHGL